MAESSPAQRAVDMFDGSPTKLAAAVGAGVLRQHVEHWVKSGRIPAEHCPAVSHVTGIPLWELRPADWRRIWPMVAGPSDAKGAEHAASATIEKHGREGPSRSP